MAQNGEFQIIERFFTHENFGAWASKGVGDDCAIIDMPAGRIAVTADMMAIGTHFLPTQRPEDIGYKALAVNLSDLAAAGAIPRALLSDDRFARARRRLAWRFYQRHDGAFPTGGLSSAGR